MQALLFIEISEQALFCKINNSFAQIANVNPYYLIGADDENGKCSDELVLNLFNELGYTKILKEYSTKSKTNLRKKAQAVANGIPNEEAMSVINEAVQKSKNRYNLF